MPPKPLTRGLLPPRSLFCPLSSTEFVEPPPWKKFLGTPLHSAKRYKIRTGFLKCWTAAVNWQNPDLLVSYQVLLLVLFQHSCAEACYLLLHDKTEAFPVIVRNHNNRMKQIFTFMWPCIVTNLFVIKPTFSFWSGPGWSCWKAVYKPVWHIPLLSVQWINSWWWTNELS